ncbi:MAG: SDR family oxidoreductase [Coriobacteriia bacterium]|nr:SDR family oxidoreductase [Coriobacteriia bacterium]
MNTENKRVLVLGASGMLGSAAVRAFGEKHEVFAAARSSEELENMSIDARRLGVDEAHLLTGFNARDPESVIPILDACKPDVVFNSVGIISQQSDAANDRLMVEVNSVWPHALAQFCEVKNSRLIHMSTDCVFSGRQGAYKEEDIPDAYDMYGRSKLLGEIATSSNAVTIRTSIIGWQFGPQVSLAGWFAENRNKSLRGYTNAIFSGLPTSELCKAIRDYVLPNENLEGLYQVSAKPIDKYSLLKLLAEKMGWSVDLTPDDSLKVDKSLDSSRFQIATGWRQTTWDSMLENMAAEYCNYYPDS